MTDTLSADQQRTEPAPRTAAGRALVEWAHTAFPEQESIWREHALLIEAEAAEQSVPLDVTADVVHDACENLGLVIQVPDTWPDLYPWKRLAQEIARLLPSEPSESARAAHRHDPNECSRCGALIELGRDTELALAEEARSAQVHQGSEGALREALERLLAALVRFEQYQTTRTGYGHVSAAIGQARAALAASQPTAREEKR